MDVGCAHAIQQVAQHLGIVVLDERPLYIGQDVFIWGS
jgi:hypothetical protein